MIKIVYLLIFLIFSFLIYLIVKSLIRGLEGKKKIKKNFKIR